MSALAVTSTLCRQKNLLVDVSAESVTLLLAEATTRLLDQKFVRSAAGQVAGAHSIPDLEKAVAQLRAPEPGAVPEPGVGKGLVDTLNRVCVDLGGNSNRTSCISALMGLLDGAATPATNDATEDKAAA